MTPIRRLFLALNHYLSTGTHLGEGVAWQEGALVRVMLPVRADSEQDQRDFDALRARLDELAPEHGIRLGYLGQEGGMEMHSFTVRPERMGALAAALRERPGPLGWGSTKRQIDAHTWEEH